MYLQSINSSNSPITLSYKTEFGTPYDSCAIPSGEFFDIEFMINGDPYADYLVNEKNGNIYSIPLHGDCSAYQIKNNQIAQRFPGLGPSRLSYDWR